MIKIKHNSQSLDFSKAEWSGTDNQCSRQLTFEIPWDPYTKGFKNPKIKLGDMVSMYDDKKLLFVGQITNREKQASIGTASYTAMDFMNHLLRSTTTRRFKNMSPELITKSVCSEAGVGVSNLAKTKVNIPLLFAEDQSLYDIIIRAYRKARTHTKKNYQPVMDGKKVSVVVKGADSGAILDQGVDITDASYSDNIENVVNTVKIVNEKGKKVGLVKNDKSRAGYGIYQATYTKEEKVDAKKAAKALLEGTTKEASVTAIGRTACVSGKSLTIRDKALGLSGKFYIAGDSHTFENGVHMMQLDLEWRDTMESVS